ncbi:DEAD-box family helicase [Babesia caballi]|uniref:DEAD-box family helicase n=1 Tax=Babesia caballi TaxID=5871 RepID=A0AAV4M1G6_BABCB|nr:DEAD-box family helicase [Babesia caballi]
MTSLYDNISDFWTSDEEGREEPGSDQLRRGAGRHEANGPEREEHPLDFSLAFTNPLDSLAWVPQLDLAETKYSPFEVLDRDDHDVNFDIDVDLLEKQLFGDSMDYPEEELDLNLAEIAPELDAPYRGGSDMAAELQIGYDGTPDFVVSARDLQASGESASAKPVVVNIRPIEPTEDQNEPSFVVPKPDNEKSYIRTKWSVVDTAPLPPMENLIIEYPFELDEFQKRAIYHLHNMKHVFVAAHTSSGKTVVAEYAVALALSRGKKAVYTSPIKALSNQKYREFTKRFGSEAVGIITGDVSCNPNAACLIVTTEILRNLLYRGDAIIGQLGVVIFDEVHYINDLNRGVVWEEVFIMLPKSLQLVMLSATVPNYTEFADWIGAIMEREVITIVTSKRPVPLMHFLYIYGRIFLLLDNKGFNKDAYHKMYKYATLTKSGNVKRSTFKGQVQKLQRLIALLETAHKLPVVLFCFNRAKCEAYAKDMPNLNLSYSHVQRSKIHLFIKESLSGISESDRNLMQVKSIIRLLYRGIGVHHSGLLPLMKEIVEILFSRGLIKVLFATETFAMGVNMPARSVIFTSVHKHDGQKTRHLTASEYTQMAGRAGRRGLDSFGSVYIFCPDEPPDLQDLTTMMFEKSTRLESRFRITYNMLLQVHSREHMNITEMMLKSFKENNKMKNLPIFKRDGLRKRQELLTLPKVDCIYGEPSIEEYHKLDAYSRRIAHSLHANLWNHRESAQIFKTGRVLMVHSVGYCNTSSYACIVASSKGQELELKVLLLLPELYDESLAPGPVHNTISAHNHAEIKFALCESIDVANVSFVYNNVVNVKGMHPALGPTRDIGIALLAGVASELHRLVETGKLELLVFNKQLKQTSLQFYGVVLKQRDIYHDMALNRCTKCHLKDKHYSVQSRVEACRRELEQIDEHLREESLHAYDEMIAKVEVLKQLDFLDEHGRPTVKGRIATYLTTGDEITLTETIVQNVLSGLEPEECAAVLSAFVHNDRAPEKEVPAPTQAIQRARDIVVDLHNKVDVVQRALNVNVLREDHAALCNFSLSYVIYQWAIGTPFSEIMQFTDLQEGHIVRAITRLDELCRKIGQVANINGDEALQSKIEKVSNAIKRGIVFMPSLYLSRSAVALAVDVSHEVVQRARGGHGSRRLVGAQAVQARVEELRDVVRRQRQELGHEELRADVEEGVNGAHGLGVGLQVVSGDAETQLEGEAEDLVQGGVAVDLEDAKVDVLAAEGVVQDAEAGGGALVDLLVGLSVGARLPDDGAAAGSLGHLQQLDAVAHDDAGGLLEEQNAVGGGLLEGDAVAAVVEELGEALDQRHHDVAVGPAGFHDALQQVDAGLAGLLGGVDDPVEEHLVGLDGDAGLADALEVAHQPDDGGPALRGGQHGGGEVPQLVNDAGVVLHEALELGGALARLVLAAELQREELAEDAVVHGAVAAVLRDLEEAEGLVGVVQQGELQRLTLQNEAGRDDQVRRPIGVVDNVDAGGELAEEGQGLLDHVLVGHAALQVEEDLLNQPVQQVLRAVHAGRAAGDLGEALAAVAGDAALGVLADEKLLEVGQKVEVRHLQPAVFGRLGVAGSHVQKHLAHELNVHGLEAHGGDVGLVARQAEGAGAVEHGAGDQAVWCDWHGLQGLERLDDARAHGAVLAATEAAEEVGLLHAQNVVLQRVVELEVVPRGDDPLRHRQPALDELQGDLQNVRLQHRGHLPAHVGERDHHVRPHAQQVVFAVGQVLPVLQRVHGEAVQLLGPHGEGRALEQLAELVGGVDLAQQAAQLVVAVLVGEAGLVADDVHGADHEAVDVAEVLRLGVEEGLAQRSHDDQAAQAEHGARRALRAVLRVQLEQNARDLVAPQDVPALRNHHGALLLRHSCSIAAKSAGACAPRRSCPPRAQCRCGTAPASAPSPGGIASFSGATHRENLGEHRLLEVQRAPAQPGHELAHLGLHLLRQVGVDAQSDDPVLRRRREELAHVLHHRVVVRLLQPPQLHDAAVEVDELAQHLGRALEHLGASVVDVVEQELAQVSLLRLRYVGPVVRDDGHQARRGEEERLEVGTLRQDVAEQRDLLHIAEQRHQHFMRLVLLQRLPAVQRLTEQLQLLQVLRVHRAWRNTVEETLPPRTQSTLIIPAGRCRQNVPTSNAKKRIPGNSPALLCKRCRGSQARR